MTTTPKITPETGAALVLAGLEQHVGRFQNRASAIGATFSGAADEVSWWARSGFDADRALLPGVKPVTAEWAIHAAAQNAAWRRKVISIVVTHPNVRIEKRSKSGAVLTYRYT